MGASFTLKLCIFRQTGVTAIGLVFLQPFKREGRKYVLDIEVF